MKMANNKKTANIKDVAALAGVSVATISRYLNGELDRLGHQTAQRVQVAAHGQQAWNDN